MNALSAMQNLADFGQFMLFRQKRLDGVEDVPGSSDLSSSSHSSSTSSLLRFSSSSNNGSPGGGNSNVKVIPFRGHQVAGFDIDGKEMICLPQVYEIFLKNMVGGLHTVYTKLKRLDISPVICNVEQVRALRSLGAIQPGVNRCKLLETADFEKLYEDCTSLCTRPGRPSKRGAFDEWNISSGKKDKPDISLPSSSSSTSNPSTQPVFNQMLPQLTPQQILMQHFVALTQKNTRFNGSSGDEEDQNQRSCDDGTPLNLSNKNSSENSDSDSLENMRKEDSSPNNSVGGSNSMSTEGGSSNSGKMDDGNMMNKVMSLIEIASQQFKHERQELWKERNEIQVLRESFHKIVAEERDLRKKLESQTRKCAAFEKRYKFVNRQLLLVNAELRRYKERESTSSGNSE